MATVLEPRLTRLTVPARATFLAALRTSPNVTAAAEAAGVSRQAAYKWREADPDFAEEWDHAIEASVDNLEEKAWRRAETESDRLMEILLKAHRPKYREKATVEHTGRIEHDHAWVNSELKALGLDDGE